MARPIMRELTVECLACGGELRFMPGQFATRCELCEDDRPLPLRFGRDIEDTAAEAETEAEADALEGRSRWRCTGAGCGAILSATQALTACPCCASALVEERGGAPVLAAHARLGFLITSEGQARGLIRDELLRLGLTGSIERIGRVYLPTAVLAAELHGDYRGERGVEKRTNNTTYVSWTPHEGSFERPMQNVRASLAASPPAELLRRLEPWDWAFAEPYARAHAELDAPAVHVAGQPRALFEAALPDLRAEMIEEAKYDIGGDQQRVHELSYRCEAPRLRIVMLPVWVASVDGGTYILINGRTGEVAVAGHASAAPDEQEHELAPTRPWYQSPLLWFVVIVLAAVGLAFATS